VENQLSNSESLRSEFLSTGDAAEAVFGRTTMVDELVAHAYRSWLAAAFPSGMTVLAVGGYGRRELYPYSDVDLLLLVSKPVQGDEKREALSGFLRTLWDSGLRLSQSVHTIGECCQFEQTNVELSISLLDQRFLVGDHSLYEELAERLPKFFHGHRHELMRHLCQLARTRHSKYHNTIYHLEPNIKDTPGGMRDLHLVHWLSLLREADDDTFSRLQPAREFLAVLRCNLHFSAGRDSNLLTFDLQEKLAIDPAEWMREYYRHARDIHRAALRHMELSETQTESGLSRSFREWRSRLSNAEFTVSRERVFLRSPQQLTGDPALVLRLLEFVGHHGIRLSLETERRIHDSRLYFQEYFAAQQTLWPALSAILSQPHASLAVRTMYETGLLLAIFPDWEQIECLVVRDFYHRYTVDEHTLVTLEYLEELRATENPPRRRFAELLAETDNLPLLFVALLFHDTGKSGGLEGHAIESARIANRVLERIGMSGSDRRTVVFLVEHHLDLSAVMNSRDLSDPATAEYLAARVETIEFLKQLTLLTYADISAVNPDAMTPWRLEQLWRTYIITYRELTRELETERIHSKSSGERDAFLEGFPIRYLRTHTDEQIRDHMELARKSKETGVAVDLRRESGTYVLTVVSSDRPFLFASLAGALSSFGLNILKAEAFSNRQNTTLDTFTFSDPMRTLELNPMEADRLRHIVQRAALGKEDIKKLLKGRERPASVPRIQLPQPTVAFDTEASNHATLVEIVAEDRPGLLYDFASTFSAEGCSIEVVLIDTEAHKALDVFYVTKEGRKLDESVQNDLRTRLLAVCNG
jgi:[protein-PII] uridylyltransferase